jgi:hypothetical protein
MKANKAAKTQEDDLRPEYRFDYSKSRPNRFAAMFVRVAVPSGKSKKNNNKK